MANIPPPILTPPTNPTPPPAKAKSSNGAIIAVIVVVSILLLVPILAAIIFPVFAQARIAALQTACMSNAKRIALGEIMYAGDYDDHFSPSASWQTDTTGHLGGAPEPRCPRLPVGQVGYAMNDAMNRAALPKIAEPKATILFFESQDTGRNAHGNPGRDLVTSPRHAQKDVYGFADGSVRIRPRRGTQ